MNKACRIFISHSANAVEEPSTQVFLDALINAIAAEDGFEPLADQTDLQAGDVWMQQLYIWMGLCDAAVVVLSPRAVIRENSVWVPRETNLLLWRKSLDQRFVVIPVLIGGLKASDLSANPFLSDVRLRDLQFAEGLADTDKIPLIVQALKDKLATQHMRLAFDPLRVHVEDCLQRFAPSESISHTLDFHFGNDLWQPLVPSTQKLSLKLLQEAASAEVDVAINSVATGSQAEMRLGVRLFESLYPLRLPAEPACRLVMLCQDQPAAGPVIVSARDTWIIEMLLRAATGLPTFDFARHWEIVALPDGWGEDDLAEITRALAEELSERIGGTGTWDLLSMQTDPVLRLQEQLEQLREMLISARQSRRAPVVVCVAYRRRWVELAAELAKIFPTLAFVFWTREPEPAVIPDDGSCALLEPTWPAGKDFTWRLDYQLKHKQFGGPST